MMEYAAHRGLGNGEEHPTMEWEDGLPEDDDLTPLSQILIPLELASAFNIKSEPYRTPVDVVQATHNTLSTLRGSHRPSFMCNPLKPFNELTVEECDNDNLRNKIRRSESIDDAGSTLRCENSNTGEDQSAGTLKRPRLIWTPQLHKRFVDVVSRLGIKSAVPKTIMHLMNVEGLTRENVASHLQKYRSYQKRMQGLPNEGFAPSDQLFALNDSESSSHPNSFVPVPYNPAVVPMHVIGMDQHHHPYGTMQRTTSPGDYSESSAYHPRIPGDERD